MEAAIQHRPCSRCAGRSEWVRGRCDFCAGSGYVAEGATAPRGKSCLAGIPLTDRDPSRDDPRWSVYSDGVLLVLVERIGDTRLLQATVAVLDVEGSNREAFRFRHGDLGQIDRGIDFVLGYYEVLAENCPECEGYPVVRRLGLSVPCEPCGGTGKPACDEGDCPIPAVALIHGDAGEKRLCRLDLLAHLQWVVDDLLEGTGIAGLAAAA